jgi:hypothetical protein
VGVRWLIITILLSVSLISVAGGPAASGVTQSSKDKAVETSLSSSTSSSPRAEAALLEQFTPITTRTWWAIVEGDYGGSDVVRTVDSGRHWKEVWTTPVASGDFLNTEIGWIIGSSELGSTNSSTNQSVSLYRTLDGGRAWQRLGDVPSNCQLDFVDQLHGWCIAIGAAAGSESFDLYRTLDGGSTWTLASSTGPDDTGSTPADVPFGCDPPGTPRSLDYGSRLGEPVVTGNQVAVSAEIRGTPGATAIATSTNGGLTWSTKAVPHSHRLWSVDLIDATHWILSDGQRFMATDDAVAHWRSWQSPVEMTGAEGETLTPDFITPLVGWAVPGVNGGPFWWTTNGGITWHAVVIESDGMRFRLSPDSARPVGPG